MRSSKFVESYFDAWNHLDPKGVAEHLAADGTYCDIPENQRHSRDELVASLTHFFARDRRRYELIGDILTGDNSIAFQYKVSPLPVTGNGGVAQEYRGAEFVTLAGDAAITITDYYENYDMLRPADIAGVGANGKKYAKSRLSGQRMNEYQDRLLVIMQCEQAYLQPDLTLPKLAATVGCSVNHLSQVINAGLGISFFDYLNQHRIEYAKQLLCEHGSHRRAILNIAFAAGFNSNSAFYAAFRKSSGLTPAQYRRQQLQKAY